ncbi:JAB domain-containing protein [Ruminococcus sp. YE282]|jgi:DNA repair protein RadC|uniref:JAB domain-containing protein n=1 Tax=Ruminococcus sp. YE282 TaxID=3158780 RepID=UPI0008802E93|nr:JAB domain-containing protein [Ruminococcus bromii]MEE3498405.1 JAB domain-containing protein [Ruminococcus bromii]SCY41957.1 DNA repair protein RadC [Ruminococcus bromii]
MAQSNGNEHSGHRKRLKNKFVENGFDIFEPHEALEMYLFYAIPRKDTNLLAHRLLDRYLTIGGVCDAPIDELIKDFGLSWSAAVYLKMLPEMSRLYNESKLSNDYIIDPDTLGDKFKAKFIGRTSEAVALILGDAKGKMIYFDIVSKGSINSTELPIRKIVDLALRHNAKTAFIAHNHPSGSSLPSSGDIETTHIIFTTLRGVGVNLIDHYIITDEDYVSLRESSYAGKIFYMD